MAPVGTSRSGDVRWHGGSARFRPFRGDADVAYLLLHCNLPPDDRAVAVCLEELRAQGYRAVVTGALSAGDALALLSAEFTVRERLDLLEHDMGVLPVAPPVRMRRARRSDRRRVLALDALAFERFWRLDEPGLDDALAATPAARFRVGEPDDTETEIPGYAITGRSGRHGYLQRIAVHPSVRGRGWGRSLVTDALGWLRRHGVRRTTVNTQRGNEPALALYGACGFHQLPVGLSVLGRSL
jgi:ribosomal protein S18 acetylase RimI-like enzyme